MHGGAVTTMADRQIGRTRLGRRDDVRHRGEPRLLRRHQHEGNFGKHRDRRQILHGIERHRRAVEMRIDRQYAGSGNTERVSVRGGLGHRANSNIAAGARSILDHDRLTEIFSQQRLQRADHDIGAATGRERDDDLDRLIRVCECQIRRKQRQLSNEARLHKGDLPDSLKHLSSFRHSL